MRISDVDLIMISVIPDEILIQKKIISVGDGGLRRKSTCSQFQEVSSGLFFFVFIIERKHADLYCFKVSWEAKEIS